MTLPLIFAILAVSLSFVGLVLAWDADRRKRTVQAQLKKLNDKMLASLYLNNAIAHLEEHGTGDNLGDSRARMVLEFALQTVLYSE